MTVSFLGPRSSQGVSLRQSRFRDLSPSPARRMRCPPRSAEGNPRAEPSDVGSLGRSGCTHCRPNFFHPSSGLNGPGTYRPLNGGRASFAGRGLAVTKRTSPSSRVAPAGRPCPRSESKSCDSHPWTILESKRPLARLPLELAFIETRFASASAPAGRFTFTSPAPHDAALQHET